MKELGEDGAWLLYRWNGGKQWETGLPSKAEIWSSVVMFFQKKYSYWLKNGSQQNARYENKNSKNIHLSHNTVLAMLTNTTFAKPYEAIKWHYNWSEWTWMYSSKTVFKEVDI